MKPNPLHRMPAPLEAAIQRLKMAAREACERTIESLGLAALAAHQALQRDRLLEGQFELNRKTAVFILAFNEAFDERMLRELGQRSGAASQGARSSATSAESPGWDSMSLVEDREVEAQISADRFALEVAHGCEWELREIDAYVATVLGEAGGATGIEGGRERNPLRPELVGHALVRGLSAVTERLDTRQLLLSELSRSLSALLRQAYADIVSEFRNAGVQPASLHVRHRGGGGGLAGGGASSGPPSGFDSQMATLPASPSQFGSGYGTGPGHDSRTGPHSNRVAFGPSARGAGAGGGASSGAGGGALGRVDPALMDLLRRLAYTDPGPGYGGGRAGGGSGSGFGQAWDSGAGEPLPNLIHLHREELRQASRGGLDHMVIDVIGFLFDQILADPKLPPQLARLIARLQLPVLRAALGDSSFFSSRKHPVRRFVNRIASLGAAFDDFADDAARDFLDKVKALISEVVEGDFDRLEVYEQKLKALEAMVADQAQQGTPGDAARLLAEKEDELRLRQLYAERLSSELRDLTGPAFVRDFIARTWSQVLLRAASGRPPEGGPEGTLVQKFRRTARELALSVQPKSTPAHRKSFLAELPKMMQELTEGLNLIGWPEAERRAFFGQLMPAHAEALKSPPARPLDLNMMARRVDSALERPTPSVADARKLPATLPVLAEEVVLPNLTADDRARLGLVAEQAVDWQGQLDIDLGAPGGGLATAIGGALQPVAPGLPAIEDVAEPTQGRGLADVVQMGHAYQMMLLDQWQKVRLSHVSASRSFFIFTHGERHRKTVSLTLRMLQRLCEGGRFRAFEEATLFDRATERARSQIEALSRQAAH